MYNIDNVLLLIPIYAFFYRYFKIVGLGDASKWKSALLNFGQRRPEPLSLTQLSNALGETDTIPVHAQFQLLSAIPNFHKWTYRKNTGVKKEQYFSPSGISPRNLMIQGFEEALEDGESVLFLKKIIVLVLKKVYSIKFIPSQDRRTSSKVILLESRFNKTKTGKVKSHLFKKEFRVLDIT